MPLSPYIAAAAEKRHLTANEAQTAFDIIFSGHASSEQLAAFLLALKDKGETADEILGSVRSMRAHMLAITAPPDAMDIVGTGGDARDTLNISTAVALVVAACGVTVAKHGNRASSSRSGSSDVLAALGVKLDVTPDALQRCLHEAKLAFLFAPTHHPAMRHVADVRRQLKTRTIFNLLGPLTNPANVKRHLIGVYGSAWLRPMADVLRQLGSSTAWITHGRDGMDEITTTAPTDIMELRDSSLTPFVLEPEQASLPYARLEHLKGGDAAHNAAELKRLLQGQKGTYRDIVLLNAAAALLVADKTEDLKSGVALAAEALDSGAALRTLDKLITLTNA